MKGCRTGEARRAKPQARGNPECLVRLYSSQSLLLLSQQGKDTLEVEDEPGQCLLGSPLHPVMASFFVNLTQGGVILDRRNLN